MSDTFNTTVANWQGVDSIFIEGSKNISSVNGVIKLVKPLYSSEEITKYDYFNTCLLYQNGLLIQSGHSGWNFRIKSYALNEGDNVIAGLKSVYTKYIFYLSTQPVASETPHYDYEILYSTDDSDADIFFTAPKSGYYLVYYYASGNGYIKNSITLIKDIENKIDVPIKNNPKVIANNSAVASEFLDLYQNIYNKREVAFPVNITQIQAVLSSINNGYISVIGGNYRLRYIPVNNGDIIYVTTGVSNMNPSGILFFEQEPAVGVKFITLYARETGSTSLNYVIRAPKAGYLAGYDYATGDTVFYKVRKDIEIVEQNINNEVYSPGRVFATTYLPHVHIENSKIYIGTSYNYRLKYIYINVGDEVLGVTEINDHSKYLFFSEVEPITTGITVEIINEVNASEGNKYLKAYYKATKEGYVGIVYYATTNGDLYEPFNTYDYTKQAIEDLTRPYPYYYDIDNYLANKIKKYYNNAKVNGRQSDSFIFITDIHIPNNRNHSSELIEGIMKKSNITKVIFGGDIPYARVPTRDNLYDWWLKWLELYNRVNPLGTLFNVRGNHEWQNIIIDENEQWVTLTQAETYQTIMGKYAGNTLIHQDDNVDYPCYYYFDNTHAKIRFIILDGSSLLNEVDKAAQVLWLKNTLLNTLQGYKVIVFSHCPLSTTIGYEIDTYLDILKNANNRVGDLANCQCAVEVVITGHTHYDMQNWDGGILNIVTACDYFDGGNHYPLPAETVNRGDINQQIFDICNYDSTNSIISFTRIGFGNDRKFHLDASSVVVNGSITITPTITGTVSWTSYNTDSDFSKESLDNDVVSVTNSVVTGLKVGSAVVMAYNEENEREFWRIIVS